MIIDKIVSKENIHLGGNLESLMSCAISKINPEINEIRKTMKGILGKISGTVSTQMKTR